MKSLLVYMKLKRKFYSNFCDILSQSYLWMKGNDFQWESCSDTLGGEILKRKVLKWKELSKFQESIRMYSKAQQTYFTLN